MVRKEYYCLSCDRWFKKRLHFDRYANQKLPIGMRCEPMEAYRCQECGKKYKSLVRALKHKC